MVTELTDSSEAESGSDQSPDDARGGRHPSECLPAVAEGLIGNPHDGVTTEQGGEEGSGNQQRSKVTASDVVCRQLITAIQ